MREILPLYPAVVRTQLEQCVHLWAPQYKRDTDILERAQGRVEWRWLEGLECLCWKWGRAEREAKLFSIERGLRGGLTNVFKYLKTEWKQGNRHELNTGVSFWISGNIFHYEATKCWHWLLKEVVEPSTLEMFQSQLNIIWGKWLCKVLLEQVGQMTSFSKLEVLFNFNHSLLCIIWFQIWSGGKLIKIVILVVLKSKHIARGKKVNAFFLITWFSIIKKKWYNMLLCYVI